MRCTATGKVNTLNVPLFSFCGLQEGSHPPVLCRLLWHVAIYLLNPGLSDEVSIPIFYETRCRKSPLRVQETCPYYAR